jgi:hypothetical protein
VASCAANRVLSRRTGTIPPLPHRRRVASVGLRGLLATLALLVVVTTATDSVPPLGASTQPLRASYLGPKTRFSGLVALRASASARRARVVAVTFLLDG